MTTEKMLWYFDFISPFAYLQSTQLDVLNSQHIIDCKPVLFAALLEHWSNVGPAEIPPKRRWTFEHVIWLAHRDNIKLNLPEHHPFNPLPLLRLSIALNNRINVVQRLFRFVWVEGHVPQNAAAFSSLLAEYELSEHDISTPAIKSQLRSNGEAAINHNVFGVPTLQLEAHTFWGYDATDMAQAYLAREHNPQGWPEQGLARVEQFRQGPGRKKR